MGIGEFCGLPGDGLDDAWMLMSETGNGGAAGAIENPAAVLGNQPHAVAADCPLRGFAQGSMQHAAGAAAHDIQPPAARYCDIVARRASVASRRRFAPAAPFIEGEDV